MKSKIEAHVRNLSSWFSSTRRKAARELGEIAANATNQIPLAEAGAIPPLIGLLGDAHKRVRREAANALGKIARNSVNQISLAEAGATTTSWIAG